FNILIASYASAGLLEEAWKIFHAMPGRNVVSWNTMVSANAQEGDFSRAKIFLARIPQHSLVAWNAMIGGFAREGRFLEAKRLFDAAKVRDVVIWNALIHAKAAVTGGIEDVESLFSRIPCWDVISWNEMLAAYTKHGSLNRAKAFFDTRMLQRDVFSWNTMAAAFARMVHQSGAAGKKFFERMPQHNTVSWNSIAQGLSENGLFDDAKSLFESMGDRDSVSMIQMAVTYARNGHPEQAQELFSRISPRTVAVWNALLWSYARNGHLSETLATFHRIPMMNRITCTVIIEMYGECGSLIDARKVFDRTPDPNIFSWNIMLAAYAHNGHSNEALVLSQRMKDSGATVVPDRVTYVILLHACSNLGALREGRMIHASVIASGMESNVVVATAIVNMYGKCGSMGDAKMVFDKMPAKDVICWNSMISAYALNGLGKSALDLYARMRHSCRGLKPNRITFVSLLSSCSAANSLREAVFYFQIMIHDCDIQPGAEHYHFLIDLLGRSGKVAEAEELINSMPFAPGCGAWMSLLAACERHSKVELGRRAADRVFEMEPKNALAYLMLGKIYVAAGMWDELLQLKKLMEDRGLKREP
ncbi:hypothetical protein SELMODRAFT_40989, partial [Selaginella moellendorffii]